jgi:deoxynucleoside triphosphate triphosphohydrolase SAMHD1
VIHRIEASKSPSLADARAIIKRLRRRELYEFVDEYLLPADVANVIPKVTAREIAACNTTSGVALREEDIVVADSRLNYNLRDRNPVDHVKFYSSNDLQTSFHIPKDEVSLLFPEKVRCFHEKDRRESLWYLRDPACPFCNSLKNESCACSAAVPILKSTRPFS